MQQKYITKTNIDKIVKMKMVKILFRAYNFIVKSITRSLIVFKKPRKMTNDFFNNYIFVHTFQWASSECYNNNTISITITVTSLQHSDDVHWNLWTNI